MADNEAPAPGPWSALAQVLAAAGHPPGILDNMTGLSNMALHGLALGPWAMAEAGRSGEDKGGLPDRLAQAATADFRGPLAGMTTRDLLVNYLAKPLYGPEAASLFSSLIGPMDDPMRLMAQDAINGGNNGPSLIDDPLRYATTLLGVTPPARASDKGQQ